MNLVSRLKFSFVHRSLFLVGAEYGDALARASAFWIRDSTLLELDDASIIPTKSFFWAVLQKGGRGVFSFREEGEEEECLDGEALNNIEKM